jgi:Flp pilus assembly protein TadG/cytoskeletal protein CcmA (bactofilin family)
MSLNQKGSKTMREHFWQSQRGTAAVIVALMLIVLMGFGGFAIDIGNLYVVKTKMQNAVDAAVCGGGLELPNTGQATTQAYSLITANDFDPNSAPVTFTQDTVRNPGNAPEINCTMTNNARTYFMGLFGFQTVPITVLAEGILLQSGGSSVGGPFDYALFSNLNLPLSGTRNITGSVHSNHTLAMSGSCHIIGNAEGATGVTVSGTNTISGTVQADTLSHIIMSGSNDIGSTSDGAGNIAMPDYSQQIQNVAATTYTGNKTLSGVNNIEGSIYVSGSLTCSGVTTNGTGAILANGNITTSGTTTVGGSGQVCLYSANGNITISGTLDCGANGSAIIYAPNGTVTISGTQTIHGSIIANQIIISGTLTVIRDGYPVTTLTGGAGKPHVKLIR